MYTVFPIQKNLKYLKYMNNNNVEKMTFFWIFQGKVATSDSSSVFRPTCIGALGTPSRTGPLARKYLPGFPYTVDLCEGNKIITKKLFHHSQLGAPQKEKKTRGSRARAQCAHCLRRPCLTGEVDKSVICPCQIFSGFNIPKIIKIG